MFETCDDTFQVIMMMGQLTEEINAVPAPRQCTAEKKARNQGRLFTHDTFSLNLRLK